MRGFRRRRPGGLSRGRRVLLIPGGLLVVLLSACVYSVSAMQPLIRQLAETRVSNRVHRVISEAVDEAMLRGDFRYDDLMIFVRDHEGRIAAVCSNIAVCNRLQAEILDSILARIEEVPSQDLSIPVGTLLGSPLFAGRGPRLSVKMESAGTSTARFETAVSEAGINQANHRVFLKIDVDVTILLPGFTTAAHVSNEITIAETILVGNVPGAYTYFSATGKDGIEDQKDYVLNQS